jgi:hypothetical protein
LITIKKKDFKITNKFNKIIKQEEEHNYKCKWETIEEEEILFNNLWMMTFNMKWECNKEEEEFIKIKINNKNKSIKEDF